MAHEADYGWNISSKFNKAMEPGTGKWTDRRGLMDLKYENKVEAALKQMQQLGLIFKYSDLIKQIPKSYSYLYSSNMKAKVRKNPRRNYYSINPAVFIDIVTETKLCNYYDSNVLYHGSNVPTVPEWDVIIHSLRFIQDYRKNDLEVINLINNIPKFDYLTVLITMSNIWESATVHHRVWESSDANHETVVSRSFFNNEQKFEILLDKYSDGRLYNKFWQFHSEFEKLIGELILREVFFERGY
jgi:hypothetical protein